MNTPIRMKKLMEPKTEIVCKILCHTIGNPTEVSNADPSKCKDQCYSTGCIELGLALAAPDYCSNPCYLQVPRQRMAFRGLLAQVEDSAHAKGRL